MTLNFTGAKPNTKCFSKSQVVLTDSFKPSHVKCKFSLSFNLQISDSYTCVCAHTLTLFINSYFNIPAVLPELLILIEQSGTLRSKTSAVQENLTLILVFIYITYTKKKPYNKVSQLSAAVLVFKRTCHLLADKRICSGANSLIPEAKRPHRFLLISQQKYISSFNQQDHWERKKGKNKQRQKRATRSRLLLH